MIKDIQERLNIYLNFQSIIDSIISFVKEHAITIIAVISIGIILKIIIRAIYNSNSPEGNFGSREYRNEILTSMPSQSKQNFTYLYQKLDKLNNLINQVNTDLNRQRADVKSQIDNWIKTAQAEIESNWRRQQQKKNIIIVLEYIMHHLHWQTVLSMNRKKSGIVL